jgi:hypothetical protein
LRLMEDARDAIERDAYGDFMNEFFEKNGRDNW